MVEDEGSLAKLAARMLESAGHRVVIATGIASARKAFEAAGGVFDLIFTDVVLGDGNGVDLADELLRKNPGLRVVLTSGYADERSRWQMIDQRGWTCLMKPFAAQTLRKAVQEQLASTEMVR